LNGRIGEEDEVVGAETVNVEERVGRERRGGKRGT